MMDVLKGLAPIIIPMIGIILCGIIFKILGI